MKKKSLIALVLVFSLILGLALTACGKSSGGSGSGGKKTLETVVANDSELREGIEEAAAKEAGLEIKVEGNDLIYIYDLLAIAGTDEATLKSDLMKTTLSAALDEQKSVFGDICKTLESESGISGIQVIVTYTVGGDVVVSQTFTTADAN